VSRFNLVRHRGAFLPQERSHGQTGAAECGPIAVPACGAELADIVGHPFEKEGETNSS